MTATISAELFASADLVVADPETWHFPWVGADLLEEVTREQGEAAGLLLGRTTYDVFAASWPERGDDVPLAARLNAMPKTVVSDHLATADWNNTTVLRTDGDLAAAITGLKARSVGRLSVAGSITLVEGLLAAGLLDELRVVVHPVVLGAGRRLFDGYAGPRVPLEPIETTPLSGGVQVLVYRPLH